MRSFNNEGVSLKTVSIYKLNNNYRFEKINNIVIKEKC